MKVMLDLDGVVWDIMKIFVKIHNDIYNSKVKYEDIDGWWFFPRSEFETVYPLTLPRIMEYPVFEHYVDVYIFDINVSHDVSILTAEVNEVEVLKKKLDSIHIHKGSHYNELIKVDPKENKLNYEADVYIDDNPNMAKLMNQYPSRTLLLYDQPWNKKFDESKCENVWRVYGWDDIKLALYMLEEKGEL